MTPNEAALMELPTKIVPYGIWYELREDKGKHWGSRSGQLMGRSTDQRIMQKLQRDLRCQGFTEMESD